MSVQVEGPEAGWGNRTGSWKAGWYNSQLRRWPREGIEDGGPGRRGDVEHDHEGGGVCLWCIFATWHKPDSFGKRDPQLRKFLLSIACRQVFGGIFLIND